MRHPGADDLAAHAIGGLDAKEERRVARHAARCERCRAELARLAPAVAVLAESVEQHEPPPALRERLLADVRADAAPEPAPGRTRAGPTGLRGLVLRPAAGLAALALAGAGVAGYLIADEGGDGPEALPVSSSVSGAKGSLALTDGAATLKVSGMPQLERSAVYQVWVARGDDLHRSATFVPAGDGTATAAVPEALDGAAEVMVTEEPRPGRRTPSGPPLLTVRID